MAAAVDKITPMQAVFSINGPSRIILGDFCANEPQHWGVSRAFRAASQNALVQVGNEILGGRVVGQRAPRPEEVEAAEARLPQLFAGLQQKFEGLQERFPRTTRLIAYWDATVQAYNRWTLSAASIREWMNNPANDALLSQVHELRVDHGHGQIPPEMGRLSGLRQLTWFNDLAIGPQLADHLPEEFADLQQLETLYFMRSRFAELPEVLTRLPALRYLNFMGQRTPITRLPDAFERQLHSGWQNLQAIMSYEFYRAQCFLDVLGFVGDASFRRYNLDLSYFGLDYTQFTEIPFRVWFREKIALPNIPFAGFILMGEGLKKLRDFIKNSFGILGHNVWVDDVLSITFLILFSIPTATFALPFVLINFFLNLVVEPAITAVRDYFGYSRMVHVERD